ncbi:tetratricopeptide repeat protein [Aliiroseovarius sp. PrR006]|uniref:tetratricopeptide repeat protein n=1 Tax=Aliiroseovarius sp. PrR006 TaxID=2706883 RepID=UPI00351A3338
MFVQSKPVFTPSGRSPRADGDLPREISCLQQAIADNEDQPVCVYANLAEALFQKGDTAAARVALLQARRRETWQLSLDLRFLSVFQNPGFEDERADVLHRLKTLQADQPSVHEQKARVYFQLGHLDACERALREGLARHPTHQRLSRLMVRYLHRIAAWPELATTAERVLQAHPNASPVRTALIRAYTKMGCPERALPFYDDIVSWDDPNAKGLVAFGKALIGCERISEALEVADMAVSVAPYDPSVHSLRSECLAALGRSSEARVARKLTLELRGSSSLSAAVRAKLGRAKRVFSAVWSRLSGQ